MVCNYCSFFFYVNDVESNHRVVLIVALVVSITVFSALIAAGLVMIRARRKRTGKLTPTAAKSSHWGQKSWIENSMTNWKKEKKLQCREEEEAAAGGAIPEQLRHRGCAEAVADRGEQLRVHAVRLPRAGGRDRRFLRREPARQGRLRPRLQGELTFHYFQVLQCLTCAQLAMTDSDRFGCRGRWRTVPRSR